MVAAAVQRNPRSLLVASGLVLTMLAGCTGGSAPQESLPGPEAYASEHALYQATLPNGHVLWNITVDLSFGDESLVAKVRSQEIEDAWTEYRSHIPGGDAKMTYELDPSSGAIVVGRMNEFEVWSLGAAAHGPIDLGVISKIGEERTLNNPIRMGLPVGPQWPLLSGQGSTEWGRFGLESHLDADGWRVTATAPCETGCYTEPHVERDHVIVMEGSGRGVLPTHYTVGLSGYEPVIHLERIQHKVGGSAVDVDVRSPLEFEGLARHAPCTYMACEGDWPAAWSFQDALDALLRHPDWQEFADGTQSFPVKLVISRPVEPTGSQAVGDSSAGFRFTNMRGETSIFTLRGIGVHTSPEEGTVAWAVTGAMPWETIQNTTRFAGDDWRFDMPRLEDTAAHTFEAQNWGFEELEKIVVNFYAATDEPLDDRRSIIRFEAEPQETGFSSVSTSLATGEIRYIVHA